MRPIDVDKLKAYKCSICDNRERCEDREQVCSDIAEIDEQPTIDAEPVRHGRWISSQPTVPAKEWKCTACQGLVLLPVFAHNCYYRFCPNCGAKMDGGDTDA